MLECHKVTTLDMCFLLIIDSVGAVQGQEQDQLLIATIQSATI